MAPQEQDQVISVIKRWAKAFTAGNADAIMELWDKEYPLLIHQAEEYPSPFRGWSEIAAYNKVMSENASGHRDHAIHDFVADVIGDAAWCYLRGSITFDWPGMDKPIMGQVSQLFVLRHSGDQWKLIQYHEGRETPGLRSHFLMAHPEPERLTEPEPQIYAHMREK